MRCPVDVSGLLFDVQDESKTIRPRQIRLLSYGLLILNNLTVGSDRSVVKPFEAIEINPKQRPALHLACSISHLTFSCSTMLVQLNLKRT